MTHGFVKAAFAAMFALFATCSTVGAAEHGAPYFSVNGGVDRLPLLQSTATVDIVGPIADVTLKQTYENRGTATIEATYVFPVSDRGAVSALSMRIGDRVVEATLREREEARQTYEAAKESGRTAALLEQHDPGTFVMNLANILPGDRIDVELRYSELLVPTRGVYELELPNTFGVERYARPGDATVETPRSSAPEVTDYAFAANVHIRAAVPIAAVESPTHHVVVERPGSAEATVRLADDEVKASTRDFHLRFSLAGDEIASGLLLYPGPEENFFLLMTQPPRSPAPATVTPREYIFVLDVSGSMSGAPMDTAKALMQELLATLHPHDRFNLVLFAGGSEVLERKGSLPVGEDTLKRAHDLIDRTGAGGGTELIPALETAYALPHADGMSRSIVILTDGGIAAGGQASHLIRAHLDEANVFAFGTGGGADVPVMHMLARAGLGEPFFAADLQQSADEIRRFREYIDRPLLTHVTAEFRGFDAYDVIPQKLPDLFAERPIVLIGKYRGAATGEIHLGGTSGTGTYSATVEASSGEASARNAPLRTLWARARIADELDARGYYGDVEDASKRDLVKLSLDYGVVTPYTSFIAVTEERRSDGTPPVKVAQPTAQRATMGHGDALADGLRLLAGLPATSVTPVKATDLRDVAGKRFRFVEGTWTDVEQDARCIVLRIRRDSPAYAKLLSLRPDLAPWFALGDRVLVRLGDYAVLVGGDGFGDYPARTLERAARG